MPRQNFSIPTLYICLAIALSGSFVFWYEQSARLWFICNLISIFVYNFIHNIELWYSSFFKNAFLYMDDNHECCCHGKCLKADRSLIWMVVLRYIGGIFACIGMYISILNVHNITGITTSLTILWTISATFWLLSCIPPIICLVQCAAHCKNSEDSTLKILKRFRTHLSLRIVHDVMLGIFWFYLAFMLDKLVYKNNNEIHAEEWRTIFMSMISWHLVIVLVREIYFSDKPYIFKGGCCDKKNSWVWFKFVRIGCILLLYNIIIYRVNKPILYTMGCSIYALSGAIVSIVIICGIHAILDKVLNHKVETTIFRTTEYSFGKIRF